MCSVFIRFSISINKRGNKPTRISNQYLLRLLATLSKLGRTNVSTQILVEVWQSQQWPVDDVFFLHFDVLAEYGFVVVNGGPTPSDDINALLSHPGVFEQQVSITQAGTDFFERYPQF